MNDKIFQEKFNNAWSMKKDGRLEEAIKLYSELYEQLIRDAFASIGGISESYSNDEAKVNNYLNGDKLACTILNNMGTILAEGGNKVCAKEYFKESINLRPDYLNFQDPIIGLKELE